MHKLQDKSLDQLFQAMLQLETLDECYRFFDDLCTVNELKSLAQRLEVARMLQGGFTYHHIEDETGASTATISRVKRCLHYGSDGYTLVLGRLVSGANPESNVVEETETETRLEKPGT